ncbi:plasmid SOS inhibition protein A [Cronobacter dublinensis subsp. dublinensis]|nr:plasmid SOS inhibition protein A [Cronobacter dublinensis subsp. dublinensis]EGT5729710.1 plasmid SOS inhibition protein A [Cronobacter dublinensis subsp. dublinensis]
MMSSTALIPYNPLQQCAMAAIANVEARYSIGGNVSELPYAKAFFRAYTGRSGVTVADIRSVDSSWNPERGGATKTDFLLAIDMLIRSRGELWTLPLTRSVATSLFPSSFSREVIRREKRESIISERDERKLKQKQSEEAELKDRVLRSALLSLQFCRPGEHKKWLNEWRDSLENSGVSPGEMCMILERWWAVFLIARLNQDWRWCESLYELLNEIDYAIQTSTQLELEVSIAGLPIYLPHGC